MCSCLQLTVHLKSNQYVTRSNTRPECVFSETDLPDGHRLGLEVGLWRADLASGVIELDSQGNVVSACDFKIYPPGILFGVPSDKLVNKHISKFLPPAEGASVADFFTDGFGGSSVSDSGMGKPRGLLKMAGSRRTAAGPVNVMRVRHLTDGRDIKLAVQAVPKASMSAGIYLVLKPVDPQFGRDRLGPYLEDPQAVEKAEQEALAAATGNAPPAVQVTTPAAVAPVVPSPKAVQRTNSKDRARRSVRFGGDDTDEDGPAPAPAALDDEGGLSDCTVLCCAMPLLCYMLPALEVPALDPSLRFSGSHHHMLVIII